MIVLIFDSEKILGKNCSVNQKNQALHVSLNCCINLIVKKMAMQGIFYVNDISLIKL